MGCDHITGGSRSRASAASASDQTTCESHTKVGADKSLANGRTLVERLQLAGAQSGDPFFSDMFVKLRQKSSAKHACVKLDAVHHALSDNLLVGKRPVQQTLLEQQRNTLLEPG